MGHSRPPRRQRPGHPGSPAEPVSESLAELLTRFGEAPIETWTDEDWEGFTLQALWRLCCDGVRDLPPYTTSPPPPFRQRDMLLEATGVDTDAMVHDVMIRFCAAYLDQGMASWQLPRRNQGFYRAFSALYRYPGWAPRLDRGLAQSSAGSMTRGSGRSTRSLNRSMHWVSARRNGKDFSRRRC